MTEHPDRIERTLEILLYAPIGVGLFLKDTAPTFVEMFVSRGRAEFDRRHDDVSQRVTTARSLGQVALAFGPPMVRQKVEHAVGDARRRAESLFAAGESDDVAVTESETAAPVDSAGPAPRNGDAPAPDAPAIRFASAAAPTTEPAPAAASGSGWASYQPTVAPGTSAELPIPGYDALSASQVVERLTGLAPDELDAVHAYEASHRQRRTILGKIEQLAG